ncbi:hypothetical protein CR161_05740 [Prosthecochloris sp. ZM]|nr:hypothetical protein CR161_05740 [Prosthecochloris sp. ZM]
MACLNRYIVKKIRFVSKLFLTEARIAVKCRRSLFMQNIHGMDIFFGLRNVYFSKIFLYAGTSLLHQAGTTLIIKQRKLWILKR